MAIAPLCHAFQAADASCGGTQAVCSTSRGPPSMAAAATLAGGAVHSFPGLQPAGLATGWYGQECRRRVRRRARLSVLPGLPINQLPLFRCPTSNWLQLAIGTKSASTHFWFPPRYRFAAMPHANSEPGCHTSSMGSGFPSAACSLPLWHLHCTSLLLLLLLLGPSASRCRCRARPGCCRCSALLLCRSRCCALLSSRPPHHTGRHKVDWQAPVAVGHALPDLGVCRKEGWAAGSGVGR